MNRFKMSFNNSGIVQSPPNNMAANLSAAPPTRKFGGSSRNVSLNAPMIQRVYKAKPGCSACGKKVM